MMNSEITIITCAIFLAFATVLACGDSINIFRRVLKEKLHLHEKIWIVFFSLLIPGFSILGYAHFHEKDFRTCLKELKKISLYRDFAACHTWFFILFIGLQPSVLWDVFHDITLALLLYAALIPFSLFLSLFSYAMQLPDFFDRNEGAFDEPHR